MSKVIYDSNYDAYVQYKYTYIWNYFEYDTNWERTLLQFKKQLFVMTAWEVAGEYVYTTAGDQDTDYLMLTLDVPGYRWSQTCF